MTKWTVESVREYIAARGYQLLDDVYTNNSTPLTILHVACGRINHIKFNNFKDGNASCLPCSYEHRSKIMVKRSFGEVKTVFETDGYSVISLESDYQTAKSYLMVRCVRGHEYRTKLQKFLLGRRCPKCRAEKLRFGRGPLHRLLRDWLTETPWYSESYRASDWRCIVSGGKNNLDLHHVVNFASIVDEALLHTEIPLKTQVSDYSSRELEAIKTEMMKLHAAYGQGVLLAKPLHQKFHSQFGLKDNNRNQLQEFVESEGGRWKCY